MCISLPVFRVCTQPWAKYGHDCVCPSVNFTSQSYCSGLLKLYVGVYIKSRHMNYLSAGYSLYLCNVMRSLLETRCKVSFIGNNFSQQTFLYRRGGLRCGPMLFFLRHFSMCVCIYVHIYTCIACINN